MGWDAPWHWVILAIVVIALFGYKKLPDALAGTRSLASDFQVRDQGNGLRMTQARANAKASRQRSSRPSIRRRPRLSRPRPATRRRHRRSRCLRRYSSPRTTRANELDSLTRDGAQTPPHTLT